MTDDCGSQGVVTQTPFAATRTADVASGITVADPAALPATSLPTTAPPPAPGSPVLDGTYRLDFDNTRQTFNGMPVTSERKQTQWWAFHSVCTPAKCVATGAALSADNQQEPSGTEAVVAEFTDGHWQQKPGMGSNDCTSTIRFTTGQRELGRCNPRRTERCKASTRSRFSMMVVAAWVLFSRLRLSPPAPETCRRPPCSPTQRCSFEPVAGRRPASAVGPSREAHCGKDCLA